MLSRAVKFKGFLRTHKLPEMTFEAKEWSVQDSVRLADLVLHRKPFVKISKILERPFEDCMAHYQTLLAPFADVPLGQLEFYLKDTTQLAEMAKKSVKRNATLEWIQTSNAQVEDIYKSSWDVEKDQLLSLNNGKSFMQVAKTLSMPVLWCERRWCELHDLDWPFHSIKSSNMSPSDFMAIVSVNSAGKLLCLLQSYRSGQSISEFARLTGTEMGYIRMLSKQLSQVLMDYVGSDDVLLSLSDQDYLGCLIALSLREYEESLI